MTSEVQNRPGTPELTAGPHPGHEPREWYTSGALLETERRRLFDHSWGLVATDDELAEPGSYVTATIGTSLLVVLRHEDGGLRAWHNVCRHRGLPLVEARGRGGRFLTCRYHQWSYDLDGRLRRVPQADQQFAGFEPADWGLHPAAAETWHGMVFANPDPATPPLGQALGILAHRLDPFLSGPMTEVAQVTYTAKCNWKLLVENHVDVYHLWYVHDRSLAMYEHRAFEWDLEAGNWWSFEPLKDPELAQHGIGAHLLFPNLMLVTTSDYFATYDAVPVSPDTTTLTLRVRSYPGADGAALVESVRAFLREDVSVCELMQTSAASSRFGTGPLAATHEAPIRAFHATLARRCRG